MPDVAEIARSSSAEKRSVQHYIDERPIWSDGTILPSVPMTAMQWRIWTLAAAGKFFEGFVVFMTGVALPLISREFGIGSAQNGLISAASLLGILIGAIGLGGMSDTFGRKKMFIIEMIIFVAFLVLLVFCTNFISLIVCLLGLGIALGCDYPTAHMIISESIPSTSRGKLVLAAFAFQAVGALGGTAVGYFVLVADPSLDAWRWMYATAIIPAVLVTVGRFFIPESANWLHIRGATQKAEEAAQRLLLRKPLYPGTDHPGAGRRRRRRGPWQGRFSGPVQRAQPSRHDLRFGALVHPGSRHLRHRHLHAHNPGRRPGQLGRSRPQRQRPDPERHPGRQGRGDDHHAADHRHRLRGRPGGQSWAASGCRCSASSAALPGCSSPRWPTNFASGTQTTVIFIGFMLFNFMTNIGPNAQTYLLAGEVFPTEIRGTGAGFAAAIGKIGAVSTAFLFPILLAGIGTSALLYILVGTSLLGAVVTWAYRIETNGVSLAEIGR